MSSSLVFNRVYRLEIQSVMLVYFNPSCELLPIYLLSDLPPLPPSQSKRTVYRQCVAVGEGGGG
jgi:hypothetical protein